MTANCGAPHMVYHPTPVIQMLVISFACRKPNKASKGECVIASRLISETTSDENK